MRYLVMLSLLTLSAPVLAADVYRSVDAQGHVQYSDQPSPGSVRVSVSGTRASTAANAAPRASTNALAKSSEQIHDQLTQQAAKQALDKDVAQSRAEQCKKAQDHYQQTIDAHRLFRIGKDGEREYLTDAEIDQTRLDARLDVESTCGKSPQ
jgi:hypothetical protein